MSVSVLYASFLFLSELLSFLCSELFQMGPDGDQRGDINECVTSGLDRSGPVWSGLAYLGKGALICPHH